MFITYFIGTRSVYVQRGPRLFGYLCFLLQSVKELDHAFVLYIIQRLSFSSSSIYHLCSQMITCTHNTFIYSLEYKSTVLTRMWSDGWVEPLSSLWINRLAVFHSFNTFNWIVVYNSSLPSSCNSLSVFLLMAAAPFVSWVRVLKEWGLPITSGPMTAPLPASSIPQIILLFPLEVWCFDSLCCWILLVEAVHLCILLWGRAWKWFFVERGTILIERIICLISSTRPNKIFKLATKGNLDERKAKKKRRWYVKSPVHGWVEFLLRELHWTL